MTRVDLVEPHSSSGRDLFAEGLHVFRRTNVLATRTCRAMLPGRGARWHVAVRWQQKETQQASREVAKIGKASDHRQYSVTQEEGYFTGERIPCPPHVRKANLARLSFAPHPGACGRAGTSGRTHMPACLCAMRGAGNPAVDQGPEGRRTTPRACARTANAGEPFHIELIVKNTEPRSGTRTSTSPGWMPHLLLQRLLVFKFREQNELQE